MLGCALLATAALVNAIPSASALNPRKAHIGFKEADICGIGSERRAGTKRAAANSRDDLTKRAAQEWREMADRCRNLAQWIDPEHRSVLLTLADEYEARAERAERS